MRVSSKAIIVAYMLVIDCHAHIYSFDEKRYPPRPNPFRPPKFVGSVEHLHHTSQAAGVFAVRAIQTVTFYGYDNSYLADSTRAHRDWICGVCTLDPDDPRSPGILRRLVREYGVKSLRGIPSNKAKSFDGASVRALWKVAVEEGITIDLFLMQYAMVESATKMLTEFPQLTFGFCHCMDLKPGPNLQRDLKAVLNLARFKNLYPKVDFIGTGSQRPYPCEDLHDAAMQVIGAYGAERCLWASSYPNEIWTPKVTYEQHLRLFTEVLPLRDSQRKLILGENARKIWFPHPRA
ncbi:MAG: amidohydrolase [Bryobacterales bacterium]|nr:amidohydrolase [Bryobacterales bacterium]